MKPTNSYLKLFDACPIKAGDVVKLLRTWKIDEFGCYCELVSPSVVGRTFDVVEKRGNEQGYYILRDQTNNRSCFIWAPFFVLELVSSSSRPSCDYLAFHQDSQLKVGDRVMVMRKAKDQELGWGVDWVPVMDKLVGKIGKITADFAVNGWEVSIDNMTDDTFLFPTFVLQKVADKQPSLQDYQITICFDKKKKYFVASVPDIPSCMADGKDYVTALKKLDETFLVLQKTYAEEKMAFPSPTSSEKARTLCRLKR